jgi:hypothetical protein
MEALAFRGNSSRHFVVEKWIEGAKEAQVPKR